MYLLIVKRMKGELTARQVASGQLPAENLKEAESDLSEARTIAEKIGAVPLLWEVCLSLGELYRTRGDDGKARELLDAARKIVADLAGKIDDEKLKETFLSSERVQSIPKT
jgi:hypothetical protein